MGSSGVVWWVSRRRGRGRYGYTGAGVDETREAREEDGGWRYGEELGRRTEEVAKGAEVF
jgi:hypothetical protein